MSSTLEDHYARETQERQRAAAASHAREKEMRAYAERTVPKSMPAATVLASAERGEPICNWFAEPAAEVSRLRQEIAATEAERDSRIGDRLDPYLRGVYRERLAPLRGALRDAEERADACRKLAQERLEATLDGLVAEQVKQRNAVLAKAVPFEDRIRELERVRGHFGLITLSSRVVGVANWLKV